jgi:hypothetical protein
MAAEQIIFSQLTNGATGALVSDRVSPRQQFITQNNRAPYVVYYRNQTLPANTKTSTSAVDEEVYILECYALTHHDALAVAEAVRSDLDRVTPGTYSGVILNGSHFRNQTDVGFDDKTELFDVEVEIVMRVTRVVNQ